MIIKDEYNKKMHVYRMYDNVVIDVLSDNEEDDFHLRLDELEKLIDHLVKLKSELEVSLNDSN